MGVVGRQNRETRTDGLSFPQAQPGPDAPGPGRRRTVDDDPPAGRVADDGRRPAHQVRAPPGLADPDKIRNEHTAHQHG